MDWFAVYTKPKNEEGVSLRLRGAGIEVLSPKIRIKKFVRYRLSEKIEPLFPCYVFARLDIEKHSHMVSYTRGVRYIVSRGRPMPVQDEAIGAITEHAKDGIITPLPPKLKEGDRVLIKEGPLKHFYGVFTGVLKGSERVAILLETLNFRVEMDKSLLRKA